MRVSGYITKEEICLRIGHTKLGDDAFMGWQDYWEGGGGVPG